MVGYTVAFVLRGIASLAGKVAFATKRISEKYTVMCHEIGLLLMTTNGAHMTSAFSSATLASRESVAKTPYFPKTIFLSGGDNGRDRRLRVQSRLK